MRKRCVALYIFALFFLALLSACSGGSGVRIASPGANNVVDPGAPITLNGSGATDLTFTISSTTCAASGSLSNQTGTSAVYTPPTSNTSDCTETITATSQAQPSRSGSITLTVKAITVSLNSSAGNTTTFPAGAAPVTLTATLHNEAAGSADVVNWSIQGQSITPAVRRGRAQPSIVSPVTCGALSSNTGTQVTYTPPATLASACSDTITASSSFNGNHATTTFTIIAPASQLSVTAPTTATAGVAIAVTVSALDTVGNVVPNYSGTVHFTSTDGAAVLPANTTLTNGTGNFNVTLKTVGTQTVSATDTVTSTITGTTGNITVNPGAATHFAITGTPASITAGTQVGFTVTALDAFNNVVTGYTGTVHFTSTDAAAVLPANATLTNGTGNFNATLKTVGSQTITATDTVNGSVTGTSGSISVSAGPVNHLAVSAPASATPNVAFNFTVTAEDQFNNTVPTFAEAVHFTSSDGSATLPANSTLTNGVGTFSATLVTLGDQTLSANDAVVGSEWIAGTAHVNVTSNPATHFSVTAPATATAGTAFNFTVQALDASNNPTSGYSGTVHFTSTDSFATLPANTTLTNGVGTFSATLVSSGTQTITATDTVTSSITGTSSNIVVSGAAATHLSIIAPATATAGTAFNFTVTAQDQFNNTATGYSGTVHFTSSDSSATLPADSTLTNGTGSFSATLQTTGTQTITGTDTVTNTITGSSGNITVSATSNTFTLNPDNKNFAVTGQPYAVQLNPQGGTQPYTNLIKTAGTLPPGMSLSLSSLALVGTPTTAGTFTFTAQLSDNANLIATSDVTVVVATGPSHQHDTWLNGRYSCQVRGYVDNNGSPYPFATVESFLFSGGGTFSGTSFDTAARGGTDLGVLVSGTGTGTVNIGLDNHGILTFTPNVGGIAKPTNTYAIVANNFVANNSAAPATEFHGVEIDDIQPNPSGQHGEISCYRQNSPFSPGGNLAFEASGVDGSGQQGAIVGVITGLSSNSFTGGETDQIDASGNLKTQQSPGSGSYTNADGTTGRFVLQINPNTSKQTDVIIYPIDATRGLLLAVKDPANVSSSNPGDVQSGEVRKQAQSSYSNSNLSGPFVVYNHATKFDTNTPPNVTGFNSTLLQGSGNSSSGFTINVLCNGTVDVNSGQTQNAAESCQFPAAFQAVTVASNGRAQFTPQGATNPVFLYFYNNNAALVLDASEGLGVGFVDAQSSRTTPSGNYIEYDLPSEDPSGSDQVGLLTLTSGSSMTFDGAFDSGGEEFFRWASPIVQGGSTPTYGTPDGSTGYFQVTTGDNPVDCLTITASKLACVSKDDHPTVHVLLK